MAPDFELPSSDGTRFVLHEALSAGSIVLYFYPRDFTMGCTAEACGFRDNYDELLQSGFRVFGVSTDAVEKHREFIKAYSFQFQLLSDVGGAVSRKYYAYNSLFKFSKRISFLIGKDGKILSIMSNALSPAAHIKTAMTYKGDKK